MLTCEDAYTHICPLLHKLYVHTSCVCVGLHLATRLRKMFFPPWVRRAMCGGPARERGLRLPPRSRCRVSRKSAPPVCDLPQSCLAAMSSLGAVAPPRHDITSARGASSPPARCHNCPRWCRTRPGRVIRRPPSVCQMFESRRPRVAPSEARSRGSLALGGQNSQLKTDRSERFSWSWWF